MLKQPNEPDPDQFRQGDIWESPRGTTYLVTEILPGKPRKAVLREGKTGAGKRVTRDWDAVGSFERGQYWVRQKSGAPKPPSESA